MSLNDENINNLIALWRKYGAYCLDDSTAPVIFYNKDWPYRCWFDWQSKSVFELSKKSALQHISRMQELAPVNAVFPVWPMQGNNSLNIDSTDFEQQLLNSNWCCAFEQTAMYLTLAYFVNPYENSAQHKEIQLKRLNTAEQISLWVEIGSDAFAYQIDSTVIAALIDDRDCQFLLAYLNGQAVACGLLFKTGNVIGLHQLGVKSGFQGQGIAKHFMVELIKKSKEWQGKYLVLQASTKGKSLYENLGFISQFHIKNYQREQTV